MKKLYSVLSVFFGILILPFNVYSSWLLYKHIHATELMWFIWWILVPLAVLFQVFSSITKKMSED